MEQTSYSMSGLAKTLWKHKLLCILIVLGCAALCTCYTLFAAPRLYESELRFALSPEDEKQGDYSYQQKAAATYANIFQGNVFLGRVIEKSGVPETAEHLGKMLRISTIGSTGLVDVRVKSFSPQASLVLAQTIAGLAQEEISRDFSVEIFHTPEEGRCVSPGILLSLGIGLAIGLALCLCTGGILLIKGKK